MNTPRACCDTIDSLSCAVTISDTSCEREGKPYSDDRFLDLLHLSRLDRPLWSPPQTLQPVLVVLDPALQLRDVIPRVSIPSVEHIPHADQGVALALDVFQDAFVPRPGFIFEQRLSGGQVFRCGVDAVVEQGDVAGVNAVGAFAGFRDGVECLCEPCVVCGEPLVALNEAFEEGA